MYHVVWSIFIQIVLGTWTYKPRPCSLESIHIGEYLQKVAALDALVFVGVWLVLRIQYKTIFPEVWVTITLSYRFVSVKQRNSPNPLFVPWMKES